MEKKTKVLLISILSVAVICIAGAIFLSNNKKYTVTFDTKGGNVISSQEVKNGNYISKPDDPVKMGYNFLYWTYNGVRFDFTKKIDKDMTLVATWEIAKQTFNVSLEVDGKKQEIEVEDGELIDLTKLTFEEKEGYEIKWKLGDKEFDIETEKITENIELVGEYVKVKTYTVTFNSNGGSKVESQKVNENKMAKEPIEPTKEGYVFDAWYLNDVKYDFKEKVTKDITLKAKWVEDNNLKRYTVTFNSDGGSNVAKQTVIENKKAIKPANPTKAGNVFVEWQLNGKAYDFSSAVTKDITLKAVWKATYTVKFELDGGSCSNCTNQTVESGKKATKPNDPNRSGYTFSGWKFDNQNFDFNTPITSNITLKASWTKVNVTPQYTVSFNLSGGSCANDACASQTVTEGGKATRPNATPYREGFAFTDWNFDFNTPITRNTIIYANWRTLNKFYVTFNANGGKFSDNSETFQKTVTEGNKVTAPDETPTRSGFSFNGWEFDFNTAITQNTIVYARWTEKVYTIRSTKADSQSPDVTLSVWDGDTQVTNYTSINYHDGALMCSSSNPTVNESEFNGESSFIVVLTDGTRVRAIK